VYIQRSKERDATAAGMAHRAFIFDPPLFPIIVHKTAPTVNGGIPAGPFLPTLLG
jgi:hypothetical protein